MRFGRLLAGTAGAVVAIVVLTTIAAGRADAHASVVGVEPSDGSVLDVAPAEAVVRFDEGVEIVRVSLVDATGMPVAPASPARVGDDGSIVRVGLPALGSGSYALSWRVVSADGHPVDGAVTFAVGAPTPGGAGAPRTSVEGSAAAAVASATVRGVGFGANLVLAGLLGALCWWWRDASARRAVLRMGVGAALASVVTAAGAVALQVPYVRGTGIGDALDAGGWGEVLSTRFGSGWGARALLGLAAVPLLNGPPQDTARRWWRAAAALVATGLLVGIAIAAHATTGRVPVLGVALDLVHLGAAAAWLGGLVALVTGRPARPVVRRFSTLAGCAVGLVVATGVAQAIRQLDGGGLLASEYGRLVLAKLVLVAVTVGLASQARRVVRAGHGAGSGAAEAPDTAGSLGPMASGVLARIVAVEVVLAAGVVGVSAVLVASDPRPAAAVATAVSGPIGRSVLADGMLVDVSMLPGRQGPNVFHLTAAVPGANLSSRVEELTAELRQPATGIGPLTLDLDAAGPGHAVSRTVLVPTAGTWVLTVHVRLGETDLRTVEVSLPIP